MVISWFELQGCVCMFSQAAAILYHPGTETCDSLSNADDWLGSIQIWKKKQAAKHLTWLKTRRHIVGSHSFSSCRGTTVARSSWESFACLQTSCTLVFANRRPHIFKVMVCWFLFTSVYQVFPAWDIVNVTCHPSMQSEYWVGPWTVLAKQRWQISLHL